MTKLCVFLSGLILLLTPAGVFPQSGLDLGGSRTQRDVHCRDDLEYPHDNICCANCPAGTRMTSPCTRAGEKGECEECEYGTYTQHGNGLRHCFRCTQCRPDQEIVTPCSHIHDTECQCKSGRFCDPDQACEVCKKCASCEEDEEIVRPCTSTANTVCKKMQPNPVSASGKTWMIVLAIFLVGLVIMIVAVVCIRKYRLRAFTDSQRNSPDGLKAEQNYRDNCPSGERGNGEPQRPSSSSLSHLVRVKSSGMEDERMLCESLSSSASNSQHSLTGLQSSAFHVHIPQASIMVPRQPNSREDEQFLKIVPVNGEESLRKCFQFFEDLDINCHKRFFRHLGINDNVIKSKEHLSYEDRIHEFLHIWMEKEGREASLNDLLKTLLELNQRRTAETIKEKAIHSGHYSLEY